MSAFYSPVSSVYLDAKSSTTVEIHFLPFNVGERQCSIIFLNEEIGEFLYSIEAKATMPLPDALPFVKTTHSVRISSAAAAGLFLCTFCCHSNFLLLSCYFCQCSKCSVNISVNINMVGATSIVPLWYNNNNDFILSG